MTKFSLILTEAENVEPAAIRAIVMAVDEDGASSVQDIFEASDMNVLRTVLRGGSRSTSRSTSVMSNVVEDATHQAWSKAYERLAGKTLW